MSDPLDYVNPGEPLVIRSATWNAFIDAARAAKGFRREGAGPNEREPLVPCVEVYVKNTTGGTLLNWSVVTPTGYVFDPETLPIPARRHPCFEVAAPAAITDPVFVTVEPIADGKIGRAVAAGVAVCQVDVTDAAHRYAVPVAGSLFKLTSAECGPARLLVPGAVADQKQLVLLGAPPCDANEVVAGSCSTGCGSLVGLSDTACLSLEVVCKTGEFDTADFADDYDGVPLSLAKFRVTGAGTWTLQYWNADGAPAAWADWLFDYGAGSGAVVLTFSSDGSPVLTIDGKTLNLRCHDADATFAGGPRNGFAGSGTTPTADCEPNDFTLRVKCACCDIPGFLGAGWYCIEDTGPTDCYAVELLEADRCDDTIVICSGPYASQALAEVDCPPPVTVQTDCCTDPIPEVLNWAITNKVGVCVCAPDSGTVTYDAGFLLWKRWASVQFFCPLGECEENAEYYLDCNGGVWTFNGSATSVTCPEDGPLEFVFDISPTWGGSYRITFTAP